MHIQVSIVPCMPSDILLPLGPVAQSVEQRIENPCVGGSIPPQATIFIGFVAENVLQNSVARTWHVLGSANKRNLVALESF